MPIGGWNDIGGITRSGSPVNYTYTVRTDRGNRPVNYVSWFDAVRFANWLHNGQPTGWQGPNTTEDGAYDISLGRNVVRKPGAVVFLPSEDEWYKAAYYKGGGTNAGYWDYPTRSNTVPTSEPPPGANMTNGSANYDDSGYVDTTYLTTEVGAYSYRPSDSPYGTFDQGGNLGEWNETLISGLYRFRRGGSYFSSNGQLHANFRNFVSPGHEIFNVGFRVASIPEPGSLTLLVCVAISGMTWTRHWG